MRYFVVCSYDGTDFIGWQHQETGRSIQDEIEKVLSKILNEPIKILESLPCNEDILTTGLPLYTPPRFFIGTVTRNLFHQIFSF